MKLTVLHLVLAAILCFQLFAGLILLPPHEALIVALTVFFALIVVLFDTPRQA